MSGIGAKCLSYYCIRMRIQNVFEKASSWYIVQNTKKLFSVMGKHKGSKMRPTLFNGQRHLCLIIFFGHI